MNTENTVPRNSKITVKEPASEKTFRDALAGAEVLVEQRKRLVELTDLEQQIATLQMRKTELEVECIAADTALKTATTAGPRPKLNRARLTKIAKIFHDRREIEAAIKTLNHQQDHQASAPDQEPEQLKAGRDALVSWLDAPDSVQPQPLLKVAYAVAAAATLLVIWATIVIHPALIVLLLGLGALLTFLRSTDQNVEWIRLGAKRHFEKMGLKSPLSWEEAAVQGRVMELETQMKEFTHQDVVIQEPLDSELDTTERLEQELALLTVQFDAQLAEAGLNADSLDNDLKHWLNLFAVAHSARNDLVRLDASLKTASAEKSAIQESLYRFLTRQGQAPQGGAADVGSLNTALDRVGRALSKEIHP